MVIKSLIFTIFIALAFTAEAQNYQTGKSAYERGDFQTAFEHFRLLAERGHTGAQSNLGFMYSKGYGVKQDYAKSLIWLTKAAIQNDTHAQHNLGILHGNGFGVPQDHFLAYIWFSIASENGHELSLIKRDLAATRLNPEEIKLANRISRKCQLEPSFCIKYAMPGKDI